MGDSILFHEGNRRLQDQFESRRIADKLESFVRIECSLATADAEGQQPDCTRG